MHWATMAYISPPGRNIVIWGFKRHSEIMLFILLYKNICKFGAKRPERAVSRLHERFRSPPLPYFCLPRLSWESLLPCPLDPPAYPNLLLLLLLFLHLLRLWLSQKDHMLANGPPGWPAWRLEGSLVDPPISPGPRPRRRSGARPAVQRAP